MESRKIQVSAGGSFFVVLPKDWSRNVELKKGDRIDLVLEEDGSIRLLPPGVMREHVKTVSLQTENYTTPKNIDISLKANYMSGYDIIIIESKKRIEPELKKAVRASVTELIGVEVSEETSDKLVLRAIVDPTGFPFESLIKRIFALALSMYNDSATAFQERDLALASDVVERGKETMKLYRLMIRQLMLAQSNKSIAKNLGLEYASEFITLGLFARDMSRLVYHISRKATQIVETLQSEVCYGPPLANSMFKIFNVVREMMEKTFQAFLRKEVKLAVEVIEQMNEVRKLNEEVTAEVFETLGEVHGVVKLVDVLRETRRIAGYAVAIADDTIFYESTITGAKHANPKLNFGFVRAKHH